VLSEIVCDHTAIHLLVSIQMNVKEVKLRILPAAIALITMKFCSTDVTTLCINLIIFEMMAMAMDFYFQLLNNLNLNRKVGGSSVKALLILHIKNEKLVKCVVRPGRLFLIRVFMFISFILENVARPMTGVF
jgi:hypothetical protein